MVSKISLPERICPTVQSGRANNEYGYIRDFDQFDKAAKSVMHSSKYNVCPLCYRAMQDRNSLSNSNTLTIMEDIAEAFPEKKAGELIEAEEIAVRFKQLPKFVDKYEFTNYYGEKL